MTPRTKDFDVRAAIVIRLLSEGVARTDIRHELPLDTASSGGRADLVLIHNGLLHGIEIKSGADKLDRVEEQARANRQAFDKAFTIADLRHAEGLKRYCSAFHCARRGVFCWDHGKPHESLTHVITRTWNNKTSVGPMASLLWRKEIFKACGELRINARTRGDGLSHIRELVCLRDLRPLVIAALRGRGHSAWERSFWTRYDSECSQPPNGHKEE